MPLEVAVDSVESAYEAVFGGAERVMICSELSVGGLTPSIGLFEEIVRVLRYNNTDHRVLVRPRSGGFSYTESERWVMRADVEALRRAGARGFCFGSLREDFTLNEIHCRELVSAARRLPCTLNRCFDWTPNWRQAMRAAHAIGFDSVVTSGQAQVATVPVLLEMKNMSMQFEGTFDVVAGGPLDERMIGQLRRVAGISWFHGDASTPVRQRPVQQPPFLINRRDVKMRQGVDRNVVTLMRRTAERNIF